jgi:hypothetical protein
VNEARWTTIEDALTMLTFKSEQDVMAKAAQPIIGSQRL